MTDGQVQECDFAVCRAADALEKECISIISTTTAENRVELTPEEEARFRMALAALFVTVQNRRRVRALR